MTVKLGISPCPNDTFSFYALLHGKTMFDEPIEVSFLDIENLNEGCLAGRFDICKVSFHGYYHLRHRFRLLSSGSALGFGCGPLVIAREPSTREAIREKPIAVPGQMTTANLLMKLWAGSSLDLHQLPFDQIMPALKRGDFAAGVIIHESRFTYTDYGLHCVQDLGQWWEDETGLPLPLGGIVARRDIPESVASAFQAALAESIQYGWSHPDETQAFMRGHAQEMDDDVMARHVNLYVNDFSVDLGRKGHQAIDELMRRAQALRD